MNGEVVIFVGVGWGEESSSSRPMAQETWGKGSWHRRGMGKSEKKESLQPRLD